MLNRDQSQDVGDGTTAIQAGGNVTVNNVGLSYSDVKCIAQDVFQANFYKLTGNAKEVAHDRMEEITEVFLGKLQKENPKGLGMAEDPDFQLALFTVQKEYARNGNKDLGDLLVDLLVDRSKHEPRDILQIVLNESLNTAPKLTDTHLAVLAVIFLIKYTKNLRITNLQDFGNYLEQNLFPFVSKVSTKASCFQHLQFCGCGSIELGGSILAEIFGSAYRGLFFKGFDQIEISQRSIAVGLDDRFFMRCLNNPAKLQVRALNEEQLNASLEHHGVSKEDKEKIIQLFDFNKMNQVEIKETINSIRPYMEDFFDKWINSPLFRFSLTSVGIAIGHASLRRNVGKFADLAIWIN